MSFSKHKNKKRKFNLLGIKEDIYNINNEDTVILKKINNESKKISNQQDQIKKSIKSEIKNLRTDINSLNLEMNDIKKEIEKNNMLLETFILNFNHPQGVENKEENIKELNIQSLYIS